MAGLDPNEERTYFDRAATTYVNAAGEIAKGEMPLNLGGPEPAIFSVESMDSRGGGRAGRAGKRNNGGAGGAGGDAVGAGADNEEDAWLNSYQNRQAVAGSLPGVGAGAGGGGTRPSSVYEGFDTTTTTETNI